MVNLNYKKCPHCGGSICTEEPSHTEMPREEVLEYAKLMTKELDANSSKGHWSGLDIQYLISEVFYHVAKLHKAHYEKDGDKVLFAADCGNLCMMIVNNYTKQSLTKAQPWPSEEDRATLIKFLEWYLDDGITVYDESEEAVDEFFKQSLQD